MAKKPAILCNLVRGKFVGGQRNFVDTFNWLVSFCSNLRGKDGIKIDMTDTEKPVIKPDDNGKDALEVVVHVEYDAATHTFTQYKRKLAGAVKFADKSATASTVFVATPVDV